MAAKSRTKATDFVHTSGALCTDAKSNPNTRKVTNKDVERGIIIPWARWGFPRTGRATTRASHFMQRPRGCSVYGRCHRADIPRGNVAEWRRTLAKHGARPRGSVARPSRPPVGSGA